LSRVTFQSDVFRRLFAQNVAQMPYLSLKVLLQKSARSRDKVEEGWCAAALPRAQSGQNR